MSNFDWSRFATRVPVDAPVEKIFIMWASRAGMEYWFLRLSDYKRPDGTARGFNEPAQPGDTYKWLWHGWPDDVAEYGTIIDSNGKDFFSFSFGKAGKCSVSITNEEGTNIVELVQENIPTDEEGKHYWHLGCKTGWTFYLANLKSLLEGGIDLRNKNEQIKNVINS